jgi:hypothetical protein
MNAMSIATKLISLLLAGSVFFVLFKRVKVLKKYGLTSVIYILLFSILLATPTLLLVFNLNSSDFALLVIAQSFILTIGIIHVILNPSALPWYKDLPFKIQILLLLCILLLAYFFCDLSISFMGNPKLRFVWFLSLLWFIVPTLLSQTVNFLLEVPKKEFVKWYYPVNEKVADPSDEELKNPLVISFLFRKNSQNHDVSTFKAKAPAGMSLGRLFYFFINDYNERHPDSQVSFVNQNGEVEGWVFMRIKSKLFGTKEALDPESSIYNNNIRENDELFCARTN